MAQPKKRGTEPPGFIHLPAIGLTPISDIYGFVGDKLYSRVQLRGRVEPVLVTEPLHYFQQQLPTFWRKSKSRLINPDLL